MTTETIGLAGKDIDAPVAVANGEPTLHLMGYVIDGPHALTFTPERDEIELIIDSIVEMTGDDPNDYTATEVFAKGYVSAGGALSIVPTVGDEAFTDLRQANIARQREWNPGEPLSLTYCTNELAGEVGEACNVAKKLERERLGIRGSRDTVKHFAEELADVVICADLAALREGIDLDAAIVEKFNKTSDNVGLKTKMRLVGVDAGEGADTARLDAIEKQGWPNLKWIARHSTTGRGFRLHQDPLGVYDTPREAIDAFFASHE